MLPGPAAKLWLVSAHNRVRSRSSPYSVVPRPASGSVRPLSVDLTTGHGGRASGTPPISITECRSAGRRTLVVSFPWPVEGWRCWGDDETALVRCGLRAALAWRSSARGPTPGTPRLPIAFRFCWNCSLSASIIALIRPVVAGRRASRRWGQQRCAADSSLPMGSPV